MDGILLELNPASAVLFGIPREGMIGRPLTSFYENRSEFDALCAAVRAHGQVLNRELVIRDSDAALHHVLLNASLQTGPESGEERMIGSIRDITERKCAQEALRESERMFSELLQGVQFVAVVTARNGRIIFCNDYALAITGWSKEEVIGRAAKELIDPESLLQVADQKAIASHSGPDAAVHVKAAFCRRMDVAGGFNGAPRPCMTWPATWRVSPVWERISPNSEPCGSKRPRSKAKHDSGTWLMGAGDDLGIRPG